MTIILRTPSQSHEALNRLLSRLHPAHPKRKELENHLSKIDAGYAGEKLVDQTILEAVFPRDSTILSDVHLKIHDHLFIQVDTLILIKKYILIIEVKNMVGTITFQSHKGQVIRVLDGVSTSFECPIAQINRHIHSLEHMRLPLPIFKAIVFSSNRVILENVPPGEPIFFRKNLPSFIHHLNKKEDKISTSEFKHLMNRIQSMRHTARRKPLCETWSIHPEALLKGFLCKICRKPLSKVSNKTWKCTQCKSLDNNPIMHNIDDYFLLIKDSISTAECRSFFCLSSTHEAYYMLRKCNLESINNARKTIYKKKDRIF